MRPPQRAGLILQPLLKGLEKFGDYSVMILPDHPTPISTRTHASDPVPYLIYRSNEEKESGVTCFDESQAAATGNRIMQGHLLMPHFLQK